MRLTVAAAFALALTPALAQMGPAGDGEQMVLDNIHNVTGLQGTWSSGSQKVVTGPVSASSNFSRYYLLIGSQTFSNLVNGTFSPPQTTGVSFSL